MSKTKSEQKKDPDQKENSDDVPMPLTSHLGELRKRLVRIIIVILVAVSYTHLTLPTICSV